MEKAKSSKFSTIFFLITTVILAFLLIVNKSGNLKLNQYNSSTVLNKIVHIQELALVKHNYIGVIGYNDSKKIMNIAVPLTEKFFLLKYSGYIKAGVDFSNILVEADSKQKSVHVIVPKAKILDVVIDEKSIKVYNESDNAFNPIRITDYNDAIKKEKEIMRREAIREGILVDANKQAKLAISSLLKEMGFEDITITEEIVLPKPN